jgi:flagellar basal body-associated protein FliL
MSTTLAAILIALVGVIGVLAVSYTFYVVGRAEDRERREAAAPEPEPPPTHEAPPHAGLARERARRRPPRRPG